MQRNPLLIGTIVLFYFALPVAALTSTQDAALDAPPQNLRATTTSLADILAAHEKARGKVDARDTTVVENWQFVDSGMAGTETLERSGTNYHSRIVQGPFVEEYGQFNGARWHEDANGFVMPTSDIDERSFYANRVLEDASDPKNDVTVLGETQGDAPAYVLKVSRPGYKHPEYVFYDKKNAQVVRIESARSGQRIVQTYGGFRSDGDTVRAYHVHDSDGRPELDDDWTLQSVIHPPNIPDTQFQMPPFRHTVSSVSAATQIPAQFFWGDGIVVRMTVNGRGYDFLLDSMSPTSRIDRGVAEALRLPTFGQTTRLSNGKPVWYQTLVPDADVSGIHLHDFVVQAGNIAFDPTENTRIVGVLGYDFLASNVLHVDFIGGRLEALPLSDFAGADPVADAVDLPYSIDDGETLVRLGMGQTITDRAILDISIPWTMVLGSFVEDHPEDVQNLPDDKRKHATGISPFADEGTYGVKMDFWTSVVQNVRFGNLQYPKADVVTTNFPIVLHDKPVDAIVGVDVLKFYDLYFDYPYGRIILKPNALFFKTFKKSA